MNDSAGKSLRGHVLRKARAVMVFRHMLLVGVIWLPILARSKFAPSWIVRKLTEVTILQLVLQYSRYSGHLPIPGSTGSRRVRRWNKYCSMPVPLEYGRRFSVNLLKLPPCA